jgi:peptide/nickel transport system permease protein
VTDAIAQRLPVTLSLTAGAVVLSLLLGVPAGIAAALFRGRWPDRILGVGAASALAMPNYFVAMLLILFFAIWHRWLPATGFVPFSEDPWQWCKHLILPWVTLGIASGAVIARQLRSSMIGVLGQDYIRTARAKGLRGRNVVMKHSIKNAAIPVVTVLGAQIAFLLGGSVIVERVFGMAGLGDLTIAAVLRRDLPVIQGVVILVAVVVLVANLFVDLTYGYLNPKVRVR